MNKFWIKNGLTNEFVAACNTYEKGIEKIIELGPVYSLVYKQSNSPIGQPSDVDFNVSEEILDEVLVCSTDDLPF